MENIYIGRRCDDVVTGVCNVITGERKGKVIIEELKRLKERKRDPERKRRARDSRNPQSF